MEENWLQISVSWFKELTSGGGGGGGGNQFSSQCGLELILTKCVANLPSAPNHSKHYDNQ